MYSKFYVVYVGGLIYYFTLFFCKQKTAYEMRISDWSSDVCSSDLVGQQELVERRRGVRAHQVDLREQLQDVVVLGEAQVFVLQRLVSGDDLRIHLRME